MTRTATITRTPRETEVEVSRNLDGTGLGSISTGVGFFDHLLDSLAHHALFDLSVATRGDLAVDDHHTVEDTSLVLGQAIAEALGARSGIVRFGDATVPMDESVATAIVDAGGRPYAVLDLSLRTERIGALTTQNIPHALEALARSARLTLHVSAVGHNDHHIAEASFKALARALRTAVALDPRRTGVASTKGKV